LSSLSRPGWLRRGFVFPFDLHVVRPCFETLRSSGVRRGLSCFTLPRLLPAKKSRLRSAGIPDPSTTPSTTPSTAPKSPKKGPFPNSVQVGSPLFRGLSRRSMRGSSSSSVSFVNLLIVAGGGGAARRFCTFKLQASKAIVQADVISPPDVLAASTLSGQRAES
jgi:hypothetical protein